MGSCMCDRDASELRAAVRSTPIQGGLKDSKHNRIAERGRHKAIMQTTEMLLERETDQ